MAGVMLIIFREALEAALVVGILAAATRGLPGRARLLGGGVLAGLLGSLLVALLTGRISALADGVGQEIFNAAVLGIAVLMLAWHSLWMARHGASLAAAARRAGESVRSGVRAPAALFAVAALTVLREGAESALFVYGLAASAGTGPAALAGGVLAGLAAGLLAGFVLYAGVLAIPAGRIFAVTGALIVMLAAGMAGKMARFLVQADLLPGLASPLWDLSGVLPNESAPGSVLGALVGYEATPCGMQVLFQVVTLATIATGMLFLRPRKDQTNNHSHLD